MKHFIRKSGSVFLGTDLYKALGKNPSKQDIEEHVWHLVSEKYPQKDAVSAFHEILNNLRVESGLSQYRRSGKKRGQVITSSAGALGMGQQIPSTAKMLGVDPTNWKESVEGMVKYKTQLAQQARALGVPESDVRRVASGSYFTGADERPENQAILSAARKRDPGVTMRDILTKPQYRRERRGLKGMTKLMAKHGIESIASGLEGSVSEPTASQYYTDKAGARKKRHAPAVQGYIDAVHKNPKRHMKLDEKRGGGYEPVGGTREIAERYGTRGYLKRDTKGRPVASMPISQTRVRPEPPQWSHAPSPSAPSTPKAPIASGEGPWTPSPQSTPTARRAATSKPSVTKSISFKSELFVEE